MKCSEITYKKVSELVLLPENPRTITKNDFERLVDSIKINGFWKHRPLAVMERDGKLVVLAGNQRLKAARKLKLADVPVIFYSELTPDEEKDIILRDNINNGDWDCNALQMDEFWKDVDFGFIGLDFPSDDEKSGKGKKKAAKEAEKTEDDQNAEEETDDEEQSEEEAEKDLSTVPCLRTFFMKAITSLKFPISYWICKPERWNCLCPRGVLTAVCVKMWQRIISMWMIIGLRLFSKTR